MLPIEKYLLFWPVLAAGLLFLLLGLWLFLISERAMERAPKDPDWVRNYRKPGFSCRRAMLPAGKQSVTAWIVIPVFAILFQLAIRVNALYFVHRRFIFPNFSVYSIVLTLAAALGAICVYLSLNLLYGSSFAGFWGAMLFAASPLRTHGVSSLLAGVLLLLLLYLRTERPGFPAELLYLAAAVLFGLVISVCPPAIWLTPLLVGLHLYKVIWQTRQGKLSIAAAFLILLAALVCWAAAAVLAAIVRCFILSGFSPEYLRRLIEPIRIRYACSQLLFDTRRFLVTLPRPGLLVNPLVDAPLFGLGVWGVVSAACMVGKRGMVRGRIALIGFAAIALVWLFTARYVLPLGLAIAIGAMMKNADLGRRRLPAALIAGFGLLYDFTILVATWAVPLYLDLICRLIWMH